MYVLLFLNPKFFSNSSKSSFSKVTMFSLLFLVLFMVFITGEFTLKTLLILIDENVNLFFEMKSRLLLRLFLAHVTFYY